MAGDDNGDGHGRAVEHYRLEDLCAQIEGASFGIEEVEIVDEELLKELIRRKRLTTGLWRPCGQGPKGQADD